jgi:hypothetical protein
MPARLYGHLFGHFPGFIGTFPGLSDIFRVLSTARFRLLSTTRTGYLFNRALDCRRPNEDNRTSLNDGRIARRMSE